MARMVEAIYIGGTPRHFPGIGIIYDGQRVKVHEFQIDGLTFKRPPKRKPKGKDA